MRADALAAQNAGEFGRATALYRRAVEADPHDVDSLRMLGMVQFQRLQHRDALEYLYQAASKSRWANPAIRHDLGLVLAKLMTGDSYRRQAELLEEFVALEQARCPVQLNTSPLVSVVLSAFDDVDYLAKAIASVAAQTYPNIELVLIDDGSIDGRSSVISASCARMNFPVRLISRESGSVPASFNDGAALAHGHYLAFLDGEGYYAPERIAVLVKEIAGRQVPWGFTLVAQAGEGQEANRQPPASAIDPLLQRQQAHLGLHSNSLVFAEFNVAESTGNLFVARDFFLALGGFHDFRHSHCWNFCLRAAALDEPLVVHRPLFFRHLGDGGAIGKSPLSHRQEADKMFSQILGTILASRPVANGNPLAPQEPLNRSLLLRLVLAAGHGALIPVPLLQSLANEARLAQAPSQTLAPAQANSAARRVAVVVLGMHRSGTSALARVLNLCGAFLPPKLLPAKLTINPKGFWEPEAVVDLDREVMRRLGGSWKHVEFLLPSAGDLVDDFESTAHALLVAEYGDESTILLKDPRMSILAPLWHQALVSAGYRPVYVVPVRHPCEVAHSLHARGDMSVLEGLSLWHAYTKRIEEFADAHSEVVHIHFTELLEDWRGVVGRITAYLDIPLDVNARADEVVRFLDPRMRRQNYSENALDALPPEPGNQGIRALYQAICKKCENDATTERNAQRHLGRLCSRDGADTTGSSKAG